MKTRITSTIAAAVLIMVMLSIVLGCAAPTPTPSAAPSSQSSPTPAPVAATEKPVVLRFSDFAPPTGTRAEVTKRWLREIEKRSNNRIKVEEFWGESLMKTMDHLSGLKAGVADIVYGAGPTWFPEEFQMQQWASMTLLPNVDGRKYLVADQAYYDAMPEVRAEYDRYNALPVLWFFFTPDVLALRKPIQNWTDLAGTKLKPTRVITQALTKAAGGVNVTVSSADQLSALQKGTIDGSFGQFESSIYSYGLAEVVKQVVDNVLGMGALQGYLVNKNTLNGLPKDLQDVVLQTAKEYQAIYADQMVKGDTAARKAFTDKGIPFYKLSDANLQNWIDKANVKSISEDFANKLEAKGLPGKKALAKWLELLGAK